MIRIPELEEFTASFAQCALEPLRVEIVLEQNARIVNYAPIHFDGLLARAVVEIATQGRGLADVADDGYWIPLPLKMLWSNGGGFPLWAASVLYPTGEAVDDVYIRHKRNPPGVLHNRRMIQTSKGQWMERRMPQPTLVCSKLEARCIGNAQAIALLLDRFTHIGKTRLGRIVETRVEPFAYELDDIIWRDGRTIKPIPAASRLIAWPSAPVPVGWTPPFWKPSLFELGWPVGTPAVTSPDWYEDCPTQDILSR